MSSVPAPPPPADPPPAAASPVPPAAAAVPVRPAGRRPRDMVLSLVVLLVPILLFAVVYRVFQDGDAPVAVDAAAVVDQARRAGDFPPAPPAVLPAGWRAASATYTRGQDWGALRIGYVAASGTGLQLVESDRPVAELLGAELGASRPAGVVPVAGRPWQRYPGRPGEEALVLLTPARTLLVLGPVAAPDAAVLAGSLTEI
ncbi:hypothetical protein GCM10010124_06440 [Pilimelia terevasa]|uniref:DUF4245 domain-containing protein n=1 Tax=Pilimelia terevasa TaxID=53372 RepID=A0A8J3FGE5_9ACTN|nr:DUF4245 family protein [Pilimelia terevasa]GGK16547.1 hypothetical protein GCM10010124_06440 [Pilimelia terevasa]